MIGTMAGLGIIGCTVGGGAIGTLSAILLKNNRYDDGGLPILAGNIVGLILGAWIGVMIFR